MSTRKNKSSALSAKSLAQLGTQFGTTFTALESNASRLQVDLSVGYTEKSTGVAQIAIRIRQAWFKLTEKGRANVALTMGLPTLASEAQARAFSAQIRPSAARVSQGVLPIGVSSSHFAENWQLIATGEPAEVTERLPRQSIDPNQSNV